MVIMEVTSFIEKFATSFQKFMDEAQLSAAVSMVIDESVLCDVNVKPTIIQNSVLKLIQDLQNLHDQCDSSRTEKTRDDFQCQSCRQREEDQDKKRALNLDPSFIQITADSKEIDRRIKAFIERKQTEKDDTNRREFGAMVPPQIESTCARTDAVFTSKTGGKSHVKVSKVVNKYGPQTRPALISMPTIRPGIKRERMSTESSGAASQVTSATGVEERLHNMESFLKMKQGTTSSSVFQRLKHLEDRILHLESVSPEYSHISSSMSTSQTGEAIGKITKHDSAVQDIDNRIKELQHSLRVKKARIEMMPAPKTET